MANTWPKITALDVYAMVRNGKVPENLDFSSVAATFEKANTYVFAESLVRNAEVRGSIPLCSTIYFQPFTAAARFTSARDETLAG